MSSSRDSDSDDINPRIYFLRLIYKNVQLESYRLEDTIQDWLTSPGRTILFNGVEGVEDKYSAANIPITIRIHLANIHPSIVNYIEKYAHYNGFLHISAKYTIGTLSRQQKIIRPEESRFDFIENADGSVTCVESFFINYYKKLSDTTKLIKPQEYDKPIALVITESNIKLDKGEIKHKITSDRILLLDKLGEKLFIDIVDTTDKRYQDTKASIKLKIETDIMQRVTQQQRQRDAKQKREIEKKELQPSKVEITSKKSTATATITASVEAPATASVAIPNFEVLARDLLADPDGDGGQPIFRSSTYQIAQTLPKDSSEQAFEETISYSPEAANDALSELTEDEIDVAILEVAEKEEPRKKRSPCVIS